MKKEIRNVIEDFKAMAFILARGRDVFVHEQSSPVEPLDRIKRASYLFATASVCTDSQAFDILEEVHRALCNGRSVEFIISRIRRR